jgi:beta-glucosidase
VFVGYRGYEANRVAPRFPFGYGLSYTTFRYANLAVTATDAGSDPRHWTVSFDVTNTGSRPGAAVPQVYVHQATAPAAVARPAKELEGFAKVMLAPGQTRRVSVPLDFRSLAYFDVPQRRWRADAGTYDVLVGGSSVDIDLRGRIALMRMLIEAP